MSCPYITHGMPCPYIKGKRFFLFPFFLRSLCLKINFIGEYVAFKAALKWFVRKRLY